MAAAILRSIPPRPAAGEPRPARRRLLFGLLLVLAVYALFEVGAWVAFFLLDREPFSFARVARERKDKIAATPIPDSFRRRATQHSGPFQEVIHPYLGYALELRTTGKRPEFEVPTRRIEECGMGEPRREPGKLRIGLFGGSVAFIFSEEGTAALTRALRDVAGVAGREIEFIVAAAGGWKQPQQLMALTQLLSQGGELDWLVNLDGFNEVALHGPENARLGVFPSYPRRWPARVEVVPDVTIRFVLGRLSVAATDRIEWAKAVQAGPGRWSIAANLLWRARDRGYQREIDLATRHLIEKPSTAVSFLTQGPRYDGTDDARTMDDLVALWERSSRLMDELCRDRGIRYFHFLQPNQYVDGSKPLTTEERTERLRDDHPYRPGVLEGYPRLRAAGARLAADGVAFHDLTQVFAGVSETLYIDDCCHFNRLGNELIAERMADVIRTELSAK